jgi:hypothetical protein
MIAQIHNPADGWDAAGNVVAANSEPFDPDEIWGNFTKEELPESLGYALPVGVGHTGDYDGYTVSYREYMSRDHYRKALTCCGPHTADYMVTRLVRMAASLKGGPPVQPEPHDVLGQIDEARQVAVATALGAFTSAVYDAWNASLPNDAGPAAIVEQPAPEVPRFSAATFSWRGGSNAVDNPIARVERYNPNTDEWMPYADQSGEVQTKVKFPQGLQGVLDTYQGNQAWVWTANFEAFDAFPATVIPGGQIADGTYRFVVDGLIREAGANNAYHFESERFHVGPWEGITVTDPQVDGGGDVSFVVPPIVYPRTYGSVFAFVHDDGNAVLCKTCSFRPWASVGAMDTAQVTVFRDGGGVEVVPATLSAGRWVADTNLGPLDTASVEPGDVRDTFGETNGASYPVG